MANNCEAFQELAAAAALGGLASLTAAERRTLAEHLSACGDCRSLYREMVETADRIPLTVSPIAPPVELRQRVLAAVAAEASASHPSRPARTAGARPATGKTAMAIRPLAAAAMVLALAAGGAWGAVT
ncbi:MAG: zf-HC2 domain-containing protein, partial [Clostridia bacterium]|nr:zf-HC2 domain-containing protein [Clostridia bacterium]